MATGKTQAIKPVRTGETPIRILGKITGDIANATAGKLVVAVRVIDNGKFTRTSN